MMDKKKIDQIILFALLEASRQDDFWDRELGPIHLVKYVYLADLYYAESHDGQTYTGSDWKFHHFGPWAAEVHQRIDPAIDEAGANKKRINAPKYKDDFYRYSYADDYKYEELSNSLPFEVTGSLKKAIKEFGKDTAELLHYVYRTRPMICAAPGEHLSFEPKKEIEKKKEIEDQPEPEKLSVKRKRMKKEAIEKLKKEMTVRLDRTLTKKKEKRQSTPPRYDEVYSEGVKWVESLAGDPIKPEEGIVEVSPDFWKSSFRTDDEVC